VTRRKQNHPKESGMVIRYTPQIGSYTPQVILLCYTPPKLATLSNREWSVGGQTMRKVTLHRMLHTTEAGHSLELGVSGGGAK
jgi:hypothetical protein